MSNRLKELISKSKLTDEEFVKKVNDWLKDNWKFIGFDGHFTLADGLDTDQLKGYEDGTYYFQEHYIWNAMAEVLQTNIEYLRNDPKNLPNFEDACWYTRSSDDKPIYYQTLSTLKDFRDQIENHKFVIVKEPYWTYYDSLQYDKKNKQIGPYFVVRRVPNEYEEGYWGQQDVPADDFHADFTPRWKVKIVPSDDIDDFGLINNHFKIDNDRGGIESDSKFDLYEIPSYMPDDDALAPYKDISYSDTQPDFPAF